VRTGRFTRPDPVYAGLFNPQRWNRYAYARNNPLRFVDPSGLSELPSWYCAEFPSRPECVYPEPDVELPGRGPQGPGNGCHPFPWFASCAPEENPSDGSRSPPIPSDSPAPPGEEHEKSSCEQFAESLVEYVSGGGGGFVSRIANMWLSGVGLQRMAVANDRFKTRIPLRAPGVTGFWSLLTGFGCHRTFKCGH
jgi:hypothetical protein